MLGERLQDSAANKKRQHSAENSNRSASTGHGDNLSGQASADKAMNACMKNDCRVVVLLDIK